MIKENQKNEIRNALTHHEFVVYYQPQYKAIRGELSSAEALARWKKSDGTICMPGDFVPYMEESSLICELDWYMLREVCIFLKKRIDTKEYTVPIAVNFSRRHLAESDFVEKLCATVDAFSIPHSLIHVEITESALVNDPEPITALVAAIRKCGFHVAIDDFGSGLSSLSMVKNVDADILKIDRSLLFGESSNDRDRIVLESIYEFANRLHLTSVAEGVETNEQLGFLRTCGCDLIQGYLFAKPMPEEQFAQICHKKATAEKSSDNFDILMEQPAFSTMQLLTEVIFKRYPLVIFANLTRNSYYMMTYDNFTTTSCPASGVFDELICHGAASMHPDDQQLFADTFARTALLEAYQAGQEQVRVVTRQLGDDGVYRRVETVDYFVKSPASDDVLVITLCQNL
ncbi:MAG: EAL domain-containing protein [Lachnospiraceae bacterium]|nr:EAL domain-containing protein [Lachnospiraceae bacterium]